MDTLDELYEKSFNVNKNVHVEKYDDLYHIKNLFEDPYLILKFQNLLSKWESCNSAKPGLMTLTLPYWTANHVQRQLFDFECHWKKSTTEFIYFYWNNKCMEFDEDDLRSNNCLLPHIDSDLEENSVIFLVNLNNRPIKTGFWKFNGDRFCKNEEQHDNYCKYSRVIKEDNYDQMINNGILDKDCEIEYHFNEAIMYNGSRYHQPIIDKFYTRDNPRIILRYCYVKL